MFVNVVVNLQYILSIPGCLLLLQTQHSLNKLLDWENSHLYHKLGLRWRLSKQHCDSSTMMEYVSIIYLFLHSRCVI